ELDENSMKMFRSKCGDKVKYIEKVSGKVVEDVIALGESADYDLIVVGKGRFPSTM
ncbi:cation/H(+) antiporter 20-like, partial [Trifolium medium]|nr:cation/H(+) antiporter 20-like [Trifolium medium]